MVLKRSNKRLAAVLGWRSMKKSQRKESEKYLPTQMKVFGSTGYVIVYLCADEERNYWVYKESKSNRGPIEVRISKPKPLPKIK